MNFELLLESQITSISVLGGVLFVLVGMLMYFHPPKEINGIYGYRTASSMQSKDRWTFAQNYSARKMMRYGTTLIILGILGSFVENTPENGTIIGLALLIACPIALIIRVENALAERFQTA